MKSTNKLKNYFEQYTREKYFSDRVLQIRKDIGIPQNGINEDIPPRLSMEYIGFLMGIKYKDKAYPTYPAKMTNIYAEILKPIPKIYKELLAIQFINLYILYNQRDYSVFEYYGNSVELINFRLAYLEDKDCCDCELKVCENYMKEISSKYPVIIGISPYATQNEVIDLIKKRWKQTQYIFKELEKNNDIPKFREEKNKLLKIRTRKSTSKEIEDLIYENKNASLKNLVAIVDAKTGTHLDQGEIGKLRSLAINRREKNKK